MQLDERCMCVLSVYGAAAVPLRLKRPSVWRGTLPVTHQDVSCYVRQQSTRARAIAWPCTKALSEHFNQQVSKCETTERLTHKRKAIAHMPQNCILEVA